MEKRKKFVKNIMSTGEKRRLAEGKRAMDCTEKSAELADMMGRS